ncbi:hypothetical protein SEA_LILPHARAOH_65 [Mycobacterium phage LilPharaoh]|uniref:Uncharacterized protein n=1 Tax=Mycobacterium phage Amelie TaxID=1913035 RepID=A0A1J0GQ02_9CAUD|nr:hypothetical protein I5G92_gp64 [Mycobacterium phage Amelie]ATN90518.1 hypothetical protein SEA_LILPHARAOH_65 [Mycobacterium phage LilPharaoh]AVP42642.1 hypothetical protein SEA_SGTBEANSPROUT_65 [Mycobacterium phage SgtBeansprout]AXC37170.1 hypothetical protein SEA_BIGLEBOPS_64 [Mycobacterium phage Biglebops]QGJ93349.1 hypothetical protein PBI_MDAVU_65 [Mycobacterium phage Mdavu]UQS94464.1 hypothetical protein SEA_NUTELLO_64 [Mycobacterium phage Nutello]
MNTLHLTGRTKSGVAWSVQADRSAVAVTFGQFNLRASLASRSLAEIARTVVVSSEVAR